MTHGSGAEGICGRLRLALNYEYKLSRRHPESLRMLKEIHPEGVDGGTGAVICGLFIASGIVRCARTLDARRKKKIVFNFQGAHCPSELGNTGCRACDSLGTSTLVWD
jgi:hypothetical protein